MVHIVNAVKEHLRVSYDEHSVDALERAFNTLQGLKTGSSMPGEMSLSNIFNELFILCCEAAMQLGEWTIAECCLKIFTGKQAPTKALAARALYCDGLIALHNIPSCSRGKAKVTSHLRCATKIVTGIKIALGEWPKEAETLTNGIEHLWLAIRDLFSPGTFDSVLDITAFVLALHEKLGLGGPFSQVQWSARFAMCLRGVGRHHEAVNQLAMAADVVSRVGSERMQLQFLRLQIPFWANLPNTRSKQDYAKPILQALYVVQSFFCGITDENSATPELIAAHEKLLADPEKKEIKTKNRKALEAELTFTDPTLIMDVLSEVVLGLALCNADEVCRVSLPKLLLNGSVRPRLFGEFAQAILRARACGALDAAKALDASYLTRKMSENLFSCIKAVESTMDSARMIDDPSERAYTLQIGCVILWNLCLPLLQPETRGKLRLTLKRIVLLLTHYGSNLTSLLVHVAYESGLIEFEEDNPTSAIEQLDRALSLNYCVVNAEGNMIFPMDFPLLWLRRRCVVRKAIDSAGFSSQEDQVLHLIEQARTSNSASNRLVLLRSAANKLPPLGQVLDPATLAKDKPPHGHDRSKTSKSKKHINNVEPPESGSPRIIANPVAANIYYLLLKEAKEETGPNMYPIIEKVASALTQIDVLNEIESRELLVMKAEAHLSMAEVLATSNRKLLRTGDDSTTEIMSHISSAARISVKLCAAGYREEWIAVNACLSLINWYSEFFLKGLFLPASLTLGELYTALNQTHVDPNKEYKLFYDISFGYVMSILQSYIASKGEVDGELSCDTLRETMRKTFLYPICEANNPILRRTGEVCREVMSKWQLPSCRKKFCMLDVLIHRLLERNPEDSHHPQEQLLFLLGRLHGPLSVEEKRILVNKESLDVLRADPSVELCGRLASLSMQLPDNERVTLEICRIADHLYQDGKLGWGTKAPINTHTGKEKGHSSNSAHGLGTTNTTSNGAGVWPKPTEDDWYWYSDILLHQATVLGRLGTGIERSKRFELEKKVIVAVTNSAIAGSHGPASTRVSQITDAYHAFCFTADSFSGTSRHLLLPSLQILLSPSLLSILPLNLRGGGAGGSGGGGASDGNNEANSEREVLYGLITSMADILFTGLSEKGCYEEGIKTLNNLLLALPAKYHKIFRAFEAQFRSHLGLPITQLLNKVKGDDPEVEAAVCIAIAKSTANVAEATKCWTRALETLERRPLQKAETLIQMAEWMIARDTTSRHELVTLLLSALDCVERFTNHQSRRLFDGTLTEGSLKSLKQTMISSLAGRTLTHSDSASIRSGSSLTGGSGEPASLREVMMAIRIMYLLFVVAPDRPVEGSSFANSKRSCASTILHYVFCLWHIVAAVVRSKDNETENIPKHKPLELPEEFHAWQGFCVESEHLEIIHTLCLDDAQYNTEKLWGMLMEVCDFLVQQRWEQFTFMIFSWIEFAANWRYGGLDPRTLAVVRAIHCKCFLVGARSGWGGTSGMYHWDKPTAEYWSSIHEVLLSTDSMSSFSHWSGGAIGFTTFRGSTCYFVLSEAEDLIVLGRVEESLKWCEKLLPCALRIGNTDAVVRCRLLQARAHIMRGEGMRAVKDLSNVEEEFGSLTFVLWTELNLLKFDALLSCLKVEEAIKIAKELPQLLSLRATRIINSNGGIGKDVANNALRECSRRILHACAQRLVCLLQFHSRRFPWLGGKGNAAKQYLVEVSESLQRMEDDWESQSIALHIKQSLRPPLDEVFSTMDIEKAKEMLDVLYVEYCEAFEVTELIRSEINVAAPLSIYTKSIFTHPCIVKAYDEILVMRGRNSLDRELLKNFIFLQYNKLSMEELGIPRGGPEEMDASVLQYMRDPAYYEYMKKRRDKENMESSAQESPSKDDCKELIPKVDVERALNYFGIPLEVVEEATSEEAEAMLYRVVDIEGECCTPLQLEAVILAFTSEFYRRLKMLCHMEESTLSGLISPVMLAEEEKVRSRENEKLTKKWAVPIPTVEQVSSNRRASRKNLLSLKQKSRKSLVAEQTPKEETPVNLWINEENNVYTMIQLGVKDASRLLEYKKLAKCYIALAHHLALSDLPCAAGTAVEFAQAAEMCSFILDIKSALLQSSPESNLIRLLEKMKMDTPFLLNTAAFDDIRSSLMKTSTMFKNFDLVREWPAEPNQPKPLPPDFCALTVVHEEHTNFFLVTLRRPNGEAHSRRVQLDVNSLMEAGDEWEMLKQVKKNEIVNKSHVANTSSERTSWSLLQSLLQRLHFLTAPLWEDFGGMLTWLAPMCHMFLCLDPILQSFPLERLPVFAPFLSVQRELSLLHIRHKLSLRSGKPPSGGSIFVIDPAGEREASLQALFGAEGRPKAATSEVISSGREKNGAVFNPSRTYVRRALAESNHSNLLMDLCGSFTELVNPETLMELNLDHLHAAFMAEGTSDRSMRREQKQRMSKTSLALFYERQYVLSLLLLARGVQYFGSNSLLPLSPDECDLICKRCLPAVASGGKGLLEAARGGTGEATDSSTSAFLFYGVPHTSKQK